MSSDPIEVLREQRAYLAVLGEVELVEALDAALASLSAPKPSSVNDNAVAVNESAPVNDKLESVEVRVNAVEYDGREQILYTYSDRPISRGETLYAAPPRPEASKWERIIGNWQERVAAVGFNGVEEAIEAIEASIAPQQASAPVGVEGLAAVVRFLMGEAPLEGRWFDDPGDPHSGSAYWWRKHLTEALAQARGKGGAE